MWKWLQRGAVGVLVLMLCMSIVFWCGWISPSVNNRVITLDIPPRFGRSELIVHSDSSFSLKSLEIYRPGSVTPPNYKLNLWFISYSNTGINFPRPPDKPVCIVAGWSVSVAYWFLCLAFGTYPVIFFIRGYRYRRVQRESSQPCTQCGYDLQGNESGKCPECGTRKEDTA